MQSKADRDTSVDQLLRTTLQAAAARASTSDECVDAETIAAWTDRTLPAGSAARVETHLSQCARCQALLAALVRSTPAPVASPSLWQRWRLQWVVPIAAAASALALWIAVPSNQRTVTPPAPASLDDARQPVPSSAAPPSGAREEDRKDASANLQKRSGNQESRATRQEAPSTAADSAAATSAPLARDRTAPQVESPQETIAAPAASPAAPPPPERRELSAARQAQGVIEALSPDPANRWRIVNRTRIERSADAGLTWGTIAFPETIDLVAIRALSATSAVVTTVDGRQFRTDNTGTTWTPVIP